MLYRGITLGFKGEDFFGSVLFFVINALIAKKYYRLMYTGGK
jgi:hypothetical protein